MFSQILNNANNGMFIELTEIVSISDLEFKGMNILGFYIDMKNGNKIFVKNNDDEMFCDVRCDLIKEVFEANYSDSKYENAMPISLKKVQKIIDEEETFQFNSDFKDLKTFKWGKFIYHKWDENKVCLDILLN